MIKEIVKASSFFLLVGVGSSLLMPENSNPHPSPPKTQKNSNQEFLFTFLETKNVTYDLSPCEQITYNPNICKDLVLATSSNGLCEFKIELPTDRPRRINNLILSTPTD